MVDFIRRSAVERHVGAMAVVPGLKISKLAQKRSSPERHQRQPCDAQFERQDQSLSHGNAAVLADRAETIREGRFMRIYEKSDRPTRSAISHEMRNPLQCKGLRVRLVRLERTTYGLRVDLKPISEVHAGQQLPPLTTACSRPPLRVAADAKRWRAILSVNSLEPLAICLVAHG